MVDYKACCRLCLDPEGNLQSLLQNGIIYEKELQQKILKSLEVEILADDKLTTMICANCIEKINNWQTFKRTCTENQSKLEEWFTASTAATTNVQSSNDISNNDIQIKEEPIENVIIPPPEVILTNGDGPVMKNEPIEEDFNDLPPPLTPQGEETEEVEVVAYSENDNNVMNPDTSQDSEIIADPRRCKTCSKLLSSVTNRKKHEKVMHGVRNRNTFPVAGGSTDSDLGAAKKMKLKRVKKTIPTCPDCGKTFQSQANVVRHRRVHKIQPAEVVEAPKVQAPEIPDIMMGTQKSNILIMCEYCDQYFTSIEEIKRHKLTHTETTRSVVANKPARRPSLGSVNKPVYKRFARRCQYCNLMLRSKVTFLAHMEGHAKKKNNLLAGLQAPIVKRRNKTKEIATDAYITCTLCYKVFVTSYNFQIHMKSHEKSAKKVWCNICHRIFDNQTLLNHHKENDHKKDNDDLMPNLTTAPLIPKSPQKRRLSQNLGESVQPRVYCNLCKIMFANPNQLRNHMIHSHKNEKKRDQAIEGVLHVCKLCGKKFTTKNSLNGHRSWHKRTGQGIIALKPKASSKTATTVKCTKCNKVCINNIVLQVHILEKHSSVEMYKCEICNIDFNSSESYEEHRGFHVKVDKTQKKGHPCAQCPASFAKADILKMHIKHFHSTPEFKCQQCDRVFDKAGSLSIHLKVHEKQKLLTSGKMLICSICNHGCETPAELRTHIIEIHRFD